MIKFFVNYFYWLVRFWYQFTQRVTRIRNHDVARYTNLEELAAVLNNGVNWRSDQLKGLWDWAGHPTRMQYHIDSSHKDWGDCDDYGMYWCAALKKSGLADEIRYGFVQYKKPDGKTAGHVVTIFRTGEVWQWADYGTPTVINQQDDWAQSVVDTRTSIMIAACSWPVRRVTKRGSIAFGRARVLKPRKG